MAGKRGIEIENKGFDMGTKGDELDKAIAGMALRGLSNGVYVYKRELGLI
jgi:hypothetical protein